VVSLEDFVQTKRQETPKHPKCITCNLPAEIRDQVEMGRALNMTYKTIHDWLLTGLDEPYDIPATTIANHFKTDHHLGK